MELEIGLAATKVMPPTLPSRLVGRSRLDEMLDRAIGGGAKLVLVSAPAGSGKSTLLADWVFRRDGPASWLQVETADSDPVRFWTFLIESVGRALPEVGAMVGSVVKGSRGDADTVVSALITALSERSSGAAPLVIVLDDYHLMGDQRIHAGVERLIELCPPGVTVVVATRVDPPMRLGRMRVRGHLVEVRAADLRFEGEEAQGLLGPAAPGFTPEQVALLAERTEGWAAGLVLAGLSLGRAPDVEGFIDEFRGDDHLVVDYLSEEFLAGHTPEHRARLLRTSILDRFNGELVEAVAGVNDGRRWLTETAAANQLVIGLDRTGEWFRYHHLLGDLLRLEAERTLAAELPELHRRAAHWYEGVGDHRRAVDHWLEAGEPAEAGRLMQSYGPRLLARGQMDTLSSTLARLGDVVATMPWCSLSRAWCEFVAGRFGEAAQWVTVTHELLADEAERLVTAPLQMNIHLGEGRVGEALALARESSASGAVESHTSDLATVVGCVYAWAGMEAEARAALALAVARTEAEGVESAHLLARVFMAVVELEAGDTRAAHRTAQEAIDVATGLGMSSYYRMGPAYAVRARTGGDPDRARADAHHAVELVRRTTGDLAIAHVLAICGDTLAELGDEEGPALIGEARRIVDRLPDPGIVGSHLDRVRSRHGLLTASPASLGGMVEPLTDREMAVLRYLPGGLSQRQIAGELFVSLNTVKTHCRAIYRKLDVTGRKAAVQSAREAGLL